MTTTMGRWWRVIVFIGVLQATNVITGAESVSVPGIVAAVAAATHPFSLPSQAKLMGEKRDQCVAQANVICLVFVIPLCVPLSHILRTPIGEWKWGFTEFVAMIMAGLLATALAAVMQTRAARYITEADMGAWAATAPAVTPVVALVAIFAFSAFAPVTLPVPSRLQWTALLIVAYAAYRAVKADSAARAADPIEKELKRE
ncbi:hypothetical protein [Actinomadura sp. B10D3]|uniref:hypothetical protein n=1 Tax=Actinomadura sp. B10D3 TaxID=3153557 RepID=UPI00325EB4BD